MEIINIEKDAFDLIVTRLDAFVQEMKELSQNSKEKGMEQWVDNQDVCFMLNISPRTLQSYRDTGKISFSKINHKVYYKLSDIQEFIENNIKIKQ